MTMIPKTKGFFAEFKSFAVKGNVLDLAIAVIIGNAFSGVINSLVADIITPVIGVATNSVDLKTLAFAAAPGVIIKYGAFLQALFNFLVVAFSIFLVFKAVAAARERLFKKGEETPKAQKPEDVRLLEEIRDLLRERK